MADINIQGASPVVLEEPGSLFKNLGSTVLRGVISDIFHQMKEERSQEKANLWEGYKLQGELAIKMNDPEQITDALNNINIQMSNVNTTPNDKLMLENLQKGLNIHLSKIEKDKPKKEIQSTVTGYQETFNTAKGGGSPQFLADVIKDMEFERDEWMEKYIPEGVGNIDKVKEVSDSLNILMGDRAKFGEKYYKEGTTELKDDLSTKQLEQLVIEQESLGERSKSLQEQQKEAIDLSKYTPVSYLRDVKNDKESAIALEVLSQQIRILEEEKNKSEKIRDWNVSINALEKYLQDGKNNLEGFGALSKGVFDHLTEVAQENASYLTTAHLKSADDLAKKAKTINNAINILQRIAYIDEQGDYKFEEARDHKQHAFEEATRAYVNEDSGAISRAITSLNSAIRAEGRHLKGQAQKMDKAKKAEISAARELLGIQSGKIAESFGKGVKGPESKKLFDSDYLEGGDFQIVQDPSQIIKAKNIDTPENLAANKVAIGENMAKLVLSSNLDGIKDKKEAKKLARNALNPNLSQSIKADALDKLYIKHLQDADVDLDFEGFQTKDTSAKNLYSQYREMYNILHKFGITASAKWGVDFGEGFISEYVYGDSSSSDSYLDTLTGENYEALFK